MQGIKVGHEDELYLKDVEELQVVEKDSIPVKVEVAALDTLMILNLLKDLKRQEKQKDKVKTYKI